MVNLFKSLASHLIKLWNLDSLGDLRSRYRASTPFNARHRHKRELPCVLGGAFINPAGHWSLPCGVVTTWVSRFMTEKYDPGSKNSFCSKSSG